MNKGIYSRGYLPHWDFKGSLQAITFRLADSVPKKAIDEWKRELAAIPDDKSREKELHRRIAKYEDAGNGEAFLSDPEIAGIIQNQLIAGHPTSYKLIAWCVMPNHVHMILKLAPVCSLPAVMQRIKGASSLLINRKLERSGRLWAADYFDRFIRDEAHLQDCLAYIRNNPVKAGLCDDPGGWPFSSEGIEWSADFSPPEATPQAD